MSKARQIVRRVLPLACLALSAASVPAQSSGVTYFTRQRMPTGNVTGSLALGDVTGDGHPDAVVVGNAAIACLPGSAAGLLGAPVLTTVSGVQLGTVALGDLDADGRLDAVAIGGSQAVSALGDGTGSFGVVQTLDVETETSGTIADVTGDGAVDLVTAYSHGIGLHVGNGAGLLGALQLVPVVSGSAWTAGVEVADIEGDGDLDLVCGYLTGTKGKVGVLRGDGDGHFGLAEATTLGGSSAPDVAVGDLEGDGDVDVVSERVESSGVSLNVCLNDSTGSLAVGPTIAVGSMDSASGLAVGDVDGNGVLDIVTSWPFKPGYDDFPLWITHVTPLGALDAKIGYTLGMRTQGVACADLNGDGVADVAATDSSVTDSQAAVATLLSDGGGGLQGPEQHLADTADHGRLVDLDADGDVDVLLATDTGLGIWLSGAAAGAESWSSMNLGYSADGFGTGDFDGDGHLDAVLCDVASGRLDVLRGDGAGHFAAPLTLTGVGPTWLAVGDVNEDGFDDILLAGWTFPALTLVPGNPDGQPVPTAAFPTGLKPSQVELADMNEDGHLDAVYGHCDTAGGGPGIAVLLGNGHGNFPTAVPAGKVLAVCWNSESFALGDLNADGHLDLLLADNAVVYPLLGDGTGHLVPALPAPSSVPALGWTLSPTLVDLNGDGRLDLLANESQLADRAWKLMPGDGAGSFGTPVRFHSDLPIHWVGAADMDGDHRPDAVAVRGPIGALPVPMALLIATNVAPPFTWTDFGGALAGSAGTPSLVGTGVPAAGQLVRLAVDGMQPLSSATLVLGLGVLAQPFKGGVLVPVPDALVPGLPLDAQGFLALQAPWPAGLPSGFEVAYQAWQADAAGPKGFSATNGLLSLSP